jgi:ribosome recycling factor
MASDTLWNIEEKMRTSIEALKRELATIRTGHATPALIEHIKVEYAGALLPLNQIAGISAPEARLLVIQPWDSSNIHSIDKAILKSDLGLNPINDGSVIRLNVPPLSEERRQELMKVVRRRIEEGRIAIRNLRREAMDELKRLEKNKDISQDEHKRALDQLQKLTDAEQIGQAKEVELAEV